MRKRRSRHQRKKKGHLATIIGILLVFIVVGISFVVLAKPFDKKLTSLASSSSRLSSSAKKTGLTASSPSITASSSTSTSWLNTTAENHLPIMMFHNVSGNTPNNNYVSPATLESDFQALQQNNIYTVSNAEAYKILTTNTKPAEKMIWLTFDDGYQDFYDSAFPLLKKYKFHATSFVIISKIGQPGYMTAAELKEMHNSGYVDIQSHTVSHSDLSVMSDAQQTAELQQSKTYLDQLLGQDTITICYPSGSHNASTPTISSNLGYKMGLLDPGRTYIGQTALNAAARASDGLFLLNRYRTFTNTDGNSMMTTIANDEAYNVSNTVK